MPSPSRAAQLAIRAATERDFRRLWTTFDIERRDTWPAFVGAVLLLVRERGKVSAGIAAAYYRASRRSAGVPGSPPPIRSTPTDDEILAGLWEVGPNNIERQLASGREVADVERTTLTLMMGVATKYVLDHGRDVVMNAVKDDPRARGWTREAGGTACEFCTTLAGRTYGSEESASFPSHRSCGCSAAPAW